MTTATEISNRIIEAVMAQKLAPGSRLGEQQLAMLFDCSRTIVREALTRLATRGIVTVSARRGWYVIEPSQDEAREAFEARRGIELGLLHQLKVVDKAALRQLKSHLQREKAALAGTLRGFTARTTLIAMLYQSSHDAAQSCADHVRIVEALEAGDIARAEALMSEHIGTVQSALRLQASSDPLAGLRDALAPVRKSPAQATPSARARKPRAAPKSSTPPASDPDAPVDASTYLGALL